MTPTLKRTRILGRKLEVGPQKLRINLGAAQAFLDPKRSSSINKVMMTNLCSNLFSRQNGLRPVHSEVNEFRACNSRRACITVGGRNLEYILGWFPPVTWHQNQTNKTATIANIYLRVTSFPKRHRTATATFNRQAFVNVDSFQF